MKEMGFEKLIFDKDNTLTLDKDPEFRNLKIKKAFKKAINIFTPEEMLIVSNMPLKRYVREMVHFDKDIRHMKFIVENKPWLWQGKKPFNFTNVQRVVNDIYGDKNFFTDKSKIIMIGDNIFTDVMFGNLNDMATIKVDQFVDPENLSFFHGLTLHQRNKFKKCMK